MVVGVVPAASRGASPEGEGSLPGRGWEAGRRGVCVWAGGCPAAAMSMSHLYGTDGEDGVEMENFEVSDWDLQNEFNPHRQRHRQTKEEATYGVWAERDSDEERPSFGGKRYGPGAGGMDPPGPRRPLSPGAARLAAPACAPLAGAGLGGCPASWWFSGCKRPPEQPSLGEGRPWGAQSCLGALCLCKRFPGAQGERTVISWQNQR